MMNVINSIWYSQMANTKIIGIVHVVDEYEGDKFYIGSALGNDQADDEQHIAETGATFPLEVGAKLFNIKLT